MGIRELLSFLPSNNLEDALARPTVDDVRREDERLTDLIPSDPNVPYDVKELIESVADDNYFYEIMPHFAKNVVIGFVRMGGRTAGIVANQPAFLAGVLDIDASDKAARFIRFATVSISRSSRWKTSPGSFPGCTQNTTASSATERNRLRLHRSHRAENHAHSSQSLWRSHIVMSSKQTGSDVNLAYPMAEIAVMGARERSTFSTATRTTTGKRKSSKNMPRISPIRIRLPRKDI